MRSFVILQSSLVLLLVCVSTSFAEMSLARNFYQFDERIITSGQPSQVLLDEADADGIEVVINLVPQSEAIYNPGEGRTLLEQGVQYIHNPVNWSAPKASELQSFLALMKNHKGKKVLVHCWSNARASALVYAYKVSQAPETQAVEYERLKEIWTDVAGYDLESNQTWQNFLHTHVGKLQ